MSKVNFTAGRVESFGCPEDKGQVFLWDMKAPGLGLRATKAGAKAYIYQSKFHGKTIRVTIGDPRSWGIDKAQEEARRLQTLIDTGVDPREHRVEQLVAYETRQAEMRRKDVTFGRLGTNTSKLGAHFGGCEVMRHICSMPMLVVALKSEGKELFKQDLLPNCGHVGYRI